jgi:hypothetical protein
MKYIYLIYFVIISIIFTDALRIISIVGQLNLGYSTEFASILKYISLLILLLIALKSKWKNNVPFSIRWGMLLWLLCNIFSIMQGLYYAESYWDWKFLFLYSFTFSFIPLAFFVGNNLDYALKTIRFFFQFIFLYGFFLLPLSAITNEELYSRLMIPVSLFILFLPFLKYKWKVLIIIVAITSILTAITFRTNLIKISFSVLLLIIFWFRSYISIIFLNIFNTILLIAPIVLLLLAITTNFNLFSEVAKEEGYTVLNSEGIEQSLTGDTRTFLYMEIFTDIDYNDTWILGKGAAGSYFSDFFTDKGGAIDGVRFSTEVGILNILLRNGILGVMIYFIVLLFTSFYAINYSNNILVKLLGLFIAFRWTLSFVEEFTQFDINFFTFWFAIGLATTKSFREMTERELKVFFKL